MARFLHSCRCFCKRNSDKLFLALSWVLGLMAGGFVFRYGGSKLVSVMPLAVQGQPSIFGLLISSLFPFLICAYAVYFGAAWLLYGVCFLKAGSFAYLSCGVFAAFGSTGWLIRWLFLFTDFFAAAALYHYCHRHISGVRKLTAVSLSTYAGLMTVVSFLDFTVISQFLRRVL